MLKNNFTKFKETEQGLIPEDWELSQLDEIIDFDPPRKIKKGDNIKFVAMTDVNTFNKKISNFTEREFDGGSKFKNGDTLLSRITPCLENGKTAFVDILNENENAGGSTEFIVMSGKRGRSNSEFVYYLAISSDFRKMAIQAMVGTSGRQRVQVDRLKSHQMAIPPLLEQEKIAEVLGALDEKIELNRKMNKTLESLAQAIFKKWFIENESTTECKIGDVIEIFDSKRVPLSSRERENRKGTYPYYGATSIMDYVDGFIFDDTYLLLGEDGSVARDDGTPFTQYVWGKIWVNNHAHVLKGKNGFSTELIKVFFDNIDIKPYITGAVQQKLNQENLKSIPINIPADDVLAKVNQTIKPLFEKIKTNSIEIETLSQIRDSLLPRLMSGKLRVG